MTHSSDTGETRRARRVRRRLREFRSFVDETEPLALVTVTVASLSLLAAFVGFLLSSPLTIVPVLAFVLATGYGWLRHQSLTARVMTLTMTVTTILILGLIVVFIFVEAWPVARVESETVLGVPVPGLGWFTSSYFEVRSQPRGYGLLSMIHGTVVVTIIATLVSGPLGVATALFISEIASPLVRETVKPAVEILAGVPSIVYGFIGFTILNPWSIDRFNISGGQTYLFVGVVVGLMALPTVVSVAEDALRGVPDSMKDGSLALGATEWQSMTTITLPAAFSGVSAAVLLGVGRAIGETMAATVMLAKTSALPDPLYDVFYGYQTLTSLVASQYGNATGLHENALFAAGVVLFVSVLCLSVGSQLIEARMHRKFGGSDR